MTIDNGTTTSQFIPDEFFKLRYGGGWRLAGRSDNTIATRRNQQPRVAHERQARRLQAGRPAARRRQSAKGFHHMIRNVMSLHTKVLVVLLAVFAAGMALTPAAAQTAADTGACDYGELYHLPISPGDSGEAVAHAQCLLNEHWGYQLAVDGEYGPETRAAVEAVQRKYDLTADGIVNPCTWYAIHDDTRGYRASC
jgi:peptidoglycan hydrolase-like protein with peptidoglycan-binding domain